MKVVFLILALSLAANAQGLDGPDWKLIKEMSGPITGYPGLTVETHAARIARGDNLIKLSFRVTFPHGSPGEMLRENVPRGVDPTSIERIEGGLEMDCRTLVIKPVKSSARVFQFNGKSFKSKEPPFSIDSGNLFGKYFCERGESPTTAPILKPSRNP